ncbi:MAG: hypothetical protein IKV10_02070 [Alphaproteobacteria bacterium]|nr:hypothetical protein [Alphaproteobacteria bacterium]
MAKTIKMRSVAEIQSRIDQLERQYDAYAGNRAISEALLMQILREIAALRWVLGGDGVIPYRG